MTKIPFAQYLHRFEDLASRCLLTPTISEEDKKTQSMSFSRVGFIIAVDANPAYSRPTWHIYAGLMAPSGTNIKPIAGAQPGDSPKESRRKEAQAGPIRAEIKRKISRLIRAAGIGIGDPKVQAAEGYVHFYLACSADEQVVIREAMNAKAPVS